MTGNENRYRWRPIAEYGEDYGDVVLLNIKDFRQEIGSCLDLDFDENDWTHFTLFAPIGQEEYERMIEEANGAK